MDNSLPENPLSLGFSRLEYWSAQGLCTGLCSLPGKSFTGTSQVAPLVKNPPAIQETLVRFLDQEVPLKKDMHPTPVFLPGEFPWTEDTGGLQSMDSQSWTH